MNTTANADFLSALEAMQARADAARRDGLAALRRLLPIAEREGTLKGRAVAGALAALHDPARYRFDISQLRGLEADLVADVLAVIQMDAVASREAIASHFAQGEERFARMIGFHGLDAIT